MSSGSQRSVAELAAELQEALDTALSQNSRLADQIKEFEARAEAAEQRARETQQKLKILESLKTKEYQTVVTELFEGPSRRAVRLTVVVAIASILIGLAQTIISSIYAARSNDQAVVNFSRSLRSELQNDISLSASNTKQDLDRILRELLRDGTSEARALILQPGVPVSAVLASNEIKYYQVDVSSNASRFEVALTYSAPAHAHIYVRHEGVKELRTFKRRYVTSDQCVNGHAGSPDRCVFDAPHPGLWTVQVHGFPPEVPRGAASTSLQTKPSTSATTQITSPTVQPRGMSSPVFQLVATVR